MTCLNYSRVNTLGTILSLFGYCWHFQIAIGWFLILSATSLSSNRVSTFLLYIGIHHHTILHILQIIWNNQFPCAVIATAILIPCKITLAFANLFLALFKERIYHIKNAHRSLGNLPCFLWAFLYVSFYWLVIDQFFFAVPAIQLTQLFSYFF